MLHAALAVVHIIWAGAGAPPGGTPQPPVIVWRERAVRRPAGATTVRLAESQTTLDARWWLTPDDAASVTNAAYATSIVSNAFRGPFLLHASAAQGSATIPAFAYDAIGVGCMMNLDNGIRFNQDGNARPAGSPDESDIYVEGRAPRAERPWLGCTGPFASPRYGDNFVIHVPYGGRIYRAAAAHFAWFRENDWHADFTVAPPLAAGDVLIFRTRDGQTVKLLAASADGAEGPYLLTAARHEFLDYRYLTAHHYDPHAVFGAHE